MANRRSARVVKKPFDVDALWAIKRIGAPTISPDGRCACAAVTSYDAEKNEGTTELWLFPTGLGAKGVAGKPRRWTDGREPHVLVCDVGGGHARDVLAKAAVSLQPWEPTSEHYDIAPDGREIALTIDPQPEPGMMNRCDIVVVNLASGRVRNLSSASGLSDEHPRYSPNGRYLAWHAYDTARAFNDQGHVRLYDRRRATVLRLMPRFDRATHHLDWTP